MELLSPGLGLILWNTLAFLVLLFLLRKFAWTPILNSLKEREAKITDSIETAERVKAEMAQMKSENEALMATAREERAEIIKEAKMHADKLVNEAKEKAKEEANKIIGEAAVAIQNQKMAALTDVKNQIGTLVVEVSEKILGRELKDQAAQESYIKKVTSEIAAN